MRQFFEEYGNVIIAAIAIVALIAIVYALREPLSNLFQNLLTTFTGIVNTDVSDMGYTVTN